MSPLHCITKLLHSGFLVIGHKTKIKADVLQFPEKTDCPVICRCIVRHQGIVNVEDQTPVSLRI